RLPVRQDETKRSAPPSLVDKGVPPMKFNRRDFLWSSASLAAVAASERLFVQQSLAAQQADQATTGRGNPNERLNVCVIGIRGQGRSHIAGYAGRNNCVVTHICDADSNTPNEAPVRSTLNAAEKAQGVRPEYVQDLRRIMENQNIHA